MSPKKIPVSTEPSPLAVNPFAALDLGPLPEGPSESASQPTSQRGKPKVHRIVLRKEKSQRGGKTVIVAGDFPTHLTPTELESLARRAKQSCGCGGTVAGREIELQGQDPARIRRFFEAENFRVAGI